MVEESIVKGSCLCGNITYHCRCAVLFSANCHCKSCQKSTGSAFSPIIGIPSDTFAVRGDTLSAYASTGDSGKKITRYFCATCGTTIYGKSEAQPSVVFLKMGTLDQPVEITPQVNVYCRDKVPWMDTVNQLPQWDMMPEKN